jgi:hypothetical protein
MRLLRPALACVLLLALAAPAASARNVHFAGRAIAVPSGWPVYRLAQHPRMCVRLDRAAVYLGTPGANQRCPSSAIGRRRAILIEPPGGRSQARASGLSAPAPSPVSGGSEQYTGLGFDACAAPSARTMRAWASSPYRAVGVYIGGANRACSQPNLTAEWVGEQVGAGWSLIPTYVGLQAPTSSCSSCAKLSVSSGRAALQGTEAAEDAVEDAAAVGIGSGSPIYFDMEAYTRTTSATAATLSFISAWTEQLHAQGYVSGVYSSSSSGIADLGRAIGSEYVLPDDVWTANWNGAENVADPYLPATAWASHDRIHQYRGGHNETYGLMTINIDGDYVEGATVGSAVAGEHPALPPLTVAHVTPEGRTVRVWVRCGWPEGEECPGRIVLRTNARLPLRAPRGAGDVGEKVVRLSVGKHLFHLTGGRAHSFRVALDARGRALFERRGFLRTQMLVAIPGARKTRALRLSRSG